MDPFEAIFPDILEQSISEAGELIGEAPELQGAQNRAGSPAELFSPPKKSFGMAAFGRKGEAGPAIYLLFDLGLAIELAGRLIMLPADEIAASKKQGQLEGELLDAFSEIANIISGVLNSVFHEAFPERRLHFIKGDVTVFPAKAKEVPLPEETLSAYSGSVSLNEKTLGEIRFFLPHSLVADAPAEDAAAEEVPAAAEQKEEPAAAPEKADAAEPEPAEPAEEPVVEVTAEAAEDEAAEAAPDSESAQLAPEAVDEILTEGLAPVQEELEALLGDSIELVEPETGYRKKAELLAKTKGKLVLTRIQAAGERSGEGYMLLPLKDAVHFGGILLMMPADAVAQTIKQGKFEGDVADAFSEIANILVGCYSQQFKAAEKIGLTLKRGAVESLVAAQADPGGPEPFENRSYYLLSARIRMGDKTYGPLELFFPPELLGLAAPSAEGGAEASAGKGKQAAAASKTNDGQKTDTISDSGERIISIIGEDPEQFAVVEQSIAEADIQATRLSLEEDYRQSLLRDDPRCVFLLINKVNDQGLSKAIKVRAAMKKDCPLIVAGPDWTRSAVLKARKYGANDILMMPADREVIQKKYRKYM
jgi:chemotaxis protein CheY-P-specific phosphatase CheC